MLATCECRLRIGAAALPFTLPLSPPLLLCCLLFSLLKVRDSAPRDRALITYLCFSGLSLVIPGLPTPLPTAARRVYIVGFEATSTQTQQNHDGKKILFFLSVYLQGIFF